MDGIPPGFRDFWQESLPWIGNRTFLSWVLADVASNEKALRLRQDELEFRLTVRSLVSMHHSQDRPSTLVDQTEVDTHARGSDSLKGRALDVRRI